MLVRLVLQVLVRPVLVMLEMLVLLVLLREALEAARPLPVAVHPEGYSASLGARRRRMAGIQPIACGLTRAQRQGLGRPCPWAGASPAPPS